MRQFLYYQEIFLINSKYFLHIFRPRRAFCLSTSCLALKSAGPEKCWKERRARRVEEGGGGAEINLLDARPLNFLDANQFSSCCSSANWSRSRLQQRQLCRLFSPRWGTLFFFYFSVLFFFMKNRIIFILMPFMTLPKNKKNGRCFDVEFDSLPFVFTTSHKSISKWTRYLWFRLCIFLFYCLIFVTSICWSSSTFTSKPAAFEKKLIEL